MKLIKTTKHHYIYELSEKEQTSSNGYKYVLFNKANYEDYKPSFKYDMGNEDWQTDTLDEALDFSINY